MLVPIITDTIEDRGKNEQFELSMLAMVALGVGEICGALVMGHVVDKLGAKKSCFVNITVIIVQTIFVFIFISVDSYNFLAFFVPFIWGVQDSGISIHLDAILATEFESNKEPFSCDVLIEAIAAFSFDILASFM